VYTKFLADFDVETRLGGHSGWDPPQEASVKSLEDGPTARLIEMALAIGDLKRVERFSEQLMLLSQANGPLVQLDVLMFVHNIIHRLEEAGNYDSASRLRESSIEILQGLQKGHLA
jgi:hypothetical protein